MMTDKYFKVVLFLFINFNLLGQELQPKKSTIEHNELRRACWVVHVDPEPKTLKKAWSTFLKDNYDFKLKGIGLFSNKDLLEAEEVHVPIISNGPVHFFTHIVEDDNGSEMKVFAADQQDYLSSNHQGNGFEELAAMLKSFLKSYIPMYHRSKITDTELRIEELNREASDLEEEIAENLENIEELENEIQENRAQLESNREKLQEAQIKLEKRKAKLQRKRSTLQIL